MSKIIVAINTCTAHSHLHDEFYRSPVVSYLESNEAFELVEVYADSSLSQATARGNKIYLATEESYRNLPEKSFRMIEFISDRYQFDYLIKIDITSLTTAISGSLPTGGVLLSAEKFIDKLSDPDFYRNYNGYVELNASRKGVLNWAQNKGIVVDFDKVFDGGKIPPFFSGKLWLISHIFADYIVSRGVDKLALFKRYFPAEDVMVGSLYRDYSQRTK